METTDICQLCNQEKFKYTCPKCNIMYCSVNCYKSPNHIKCSEEFYKSCIQEELNTNAAGSKEEMQKIYEILKRIREADEGIEPENFNDALDSDDEDNNLEQNEEGEEEDFVADIASRLQGVDINNADEVWQNLLPEERLEFQKLIETGDILKLVPNYTPWWLEDKTTNNSKIVDLTAAKEQQNNSAIPNVCANILKFENICKKPPAPSVHFNLWNIISAYSCIVRFYCGEHLSNASEAVAQLVNLCCSLKYGANFEDVDEAIISVEMEGITTNAGASAVLTPALVESREQLQNDARQIMSKLQFKLAALSDILQLFKLAKHQLINGKKEQADFQKLFAMCLGSVELDKTKLKQYEKKIEFFLSYVNRESENGLK